mmetsp:Transcript_63396/g.138039  ORF Transcript_63396/g.138039 Transcript_63396/m.138039 type:complete len:266 (-) Transcript_63396:278-1075(-)
MMQACAGSDREREQGGQVKQVEGVLEEGDEARHHEAPGQNFHDGHRIEGKLQDCPYVCAEDDQVQGVREGQERAEHGHRWDQIAEEESRLARFRLLEDVPDQCFPLTLVAPEKHCVPLRPFGLHALQDIREVADGTCPFAHMEMRQTWTIWQIWQRQRGRAAGQSGSRQSWHLGREPHVQFWTWTSCLSFAVSAKMASANIGLHLIQPAHGLHDERLDLVDVRGHLLTAWITVLVLGVVRQACLHAGVAKRRALRSRARIFCLRQ